MFKQPARLWFTVLILGWLFDYLFWQRAPGIAFAVYAAVTLTAGFALLLSGGIRPAWRTLLLVPLILFFLIITFLRAEPMTLFLAHAFSLLLMAGVAVTYRGGRWFLYSAADYVTRALRLTGGVLVNAARLWWQTRAPEGQRRRGGQFLPVLRGLLLAVPVLAVFAALLSSADMVFASRLDELVKLLSLENLPEYIFRALYIAALAYALAGVFLFAGQDSSDEVLLGLEKPVVPAFLGFTEGVVVLGSVVALFALFVLIQFQYFFGGQANITLEGFTYAEYARRGFGELVLVAFFSLLLLLGLGAVVRRQTQRQQRVFAGVGLVLVLFVIVMLVSAYYRLVLYETAYGFTRLRTYTHVFMLWLGALLVATAALDLLRRGRAFALFGLLAAVGFAASLPLLNVDAFIVRQNIQRAVDGKALDVGYLGSLSLDAAPALSAALQKPGVEPALHDQIGAALACLQRFEGIGAGETRPWMSYSLSRAFAERAVLATSGELDGYRFLDERGELVTTPLGEEYSCWSETFD